MTDQEALAEERTKLLRLMARLQMDEKLDDATEAEKAKYLKDAGFSNNEIANILNKAPSTIRAQLSRV